MPNLAFLLNADFKKDFTMSQIILEQGWPESLVLPVKFKVKKDIPEYFEIVQV